MTRYALLVLGTPKAGTEEAYNLWHMNEHAPQVLEIPGFISVRRYRQSKAVTAQGDMPQWQFCSVYEIETDDIAASIAELRRRTASGEISRSEYSDSSKSVVEVLDFVTEIKAAD